MKKMMALLLALVLLVSMIPMAVSAAANAGATASSAAKAEPDYGKVEVYQERIDANGDIYYVDDNGIARKGTPDGNDLLVPVHEAGKHSLGTAFDTKYHWMACGCGHKYGMEPHVNPKDAKDGYCTCGYKFSDNSEAVVIWIDGCFPVKNFQKNVFEYEVKAYGYTEEVDFVVFPFDSESTYEVLPDPAKTPLKDGKNEFVVKVTSEDLNNTTEYKLVITK